MFSCKIAAYYLYNFSQNTSGGLLLHIETSPLLCSAFTETIYWDNFKYSLWPMVAKISKNAITKMNVICTLHFIFKWTWIVFIVVLLYQSFVLFKFSFWWLKNVIWLWPSLMWMFMCDILKHQSSTVTSSFPSTVPNL